MIVRPAGFKLNVAARLLVVFVAPNFNARPKGKPLATLNSFPRLFTKTSNAATGPSSELDGFFVLPVESSGTIDGLTVPVIDGMTLGVTLGLTDGVMEGVTLGAL